MRIPFIKTAFASTAIFLSGCGQEKEESQQRGDLSSFTYQIERNEWHLVNDKEMESYLELDDPRIFQAHGVIKCEEFSNITTVDSVTVEFNSHNGVVTFENRKGGFNIMTIAEAKQVSPNLIPEAATAYYGSMQVLNREITPDVKEALKIHAPSIQAPQATTPSTPAFPTAE